MPVLSSRTLRNAAPVSVSHAEYITVFGDFWETTITRPLGFCAGMCQVLLGRQVYC